MLNINYFNGSEATRLQRSAVQRESLTRVCAYAHVLLDQKRHDRVAHSKTQQKSGKCHPPPACCPLVRINAQPSKVNSKNRKIFWYCLLFALSLQRENVKKVWTQRIKRGVRM